MVMGCFQEEVGDKRENKHEVFLCYDLSARSPRIIEKGE